MEGEDENVVEVVGRAGTARPGIGWIEELDGNISAATL